MIRSCLLGVLVATLGCTSQPICAPWSPTTPTAAAMPTPSVQPSATAESHEHGDGTVFVSGPSPDEEWTSVVGKGAPPPAEPATVARTKPVVRTAPVAVASATRTSKPAATQAKPASSPTATPPKPAQNPANNALRAEAREIYAGRCVPCHGASGKGDGPAGGALTPHPRNFTDKAWQATVNVAHISKVIANGGPSVGKSPLMPAQADLAAKPELLRAVAEYVQAFGR